MPGPLVQPRIGAVGNARRACGAVRRLGVRVRVCWCGGVRGYALQWGGRRQRRGAPQSAAAARGVCVTPVRAWLGAPRVARAAAPARLRGQPKHSALRDNPGARPRARLRHRLTPAAPLTHSPGCVPWPHAAADQPPSPALASAQAPATPLVRPLAAAPVGAPASPEHPFDAQGPGRRALRWPRKRARTNSRPRPCRCASARSRRPQHACRSRRNAPQ